MELTIEAISGLITPIGMAAIFVWLYISEKKSHEETRRYYWNRFDEEKMAHERTRQQYRDDLREVAGMRQQLRTVQSVVRTYPERETQEIKAPRPQGNTAPLSPNH